MLCTEKIVIVAIARHLAAVSRVNGYALYVAMILPAILFFRLEHLKRERFCRAGLKVFTPGKN